MVDLENEQELRENKYPSAVNASYQYADEEVYEEDHQIGTEETTGMTKNGLRKRLVSINNEETDHNAIAIDMQD